MTGCDFISTPLSRCTCRAVLRDDVVPRDGIDDLELMRGVWHPTAQYPAEPLTTATSLTPVPFGQSLALELPAHLAATTRRDRWWLANEWGSRPSPGRSSVRCALLARRCRELPATFRYRDLRHYYDASMLIASGAGVKVVQARMRHASARTTLDTYSRLGPTPMTAHEPPSTLR